MNSLREIRVAKGLTQEKLSDLSGLYQEKISTVERGKTKANQQTRQKIEKALDRKVDWIETEGIQLKSPDWYEAERLLKRLVELTLSMDVADRDNFNKMFTKYFKLK